MRSRITLTPARALTAAFVSSRLRRIDRVAMGNFGDHRFCREGVWELRIDVGAGYRVYYAKAGQRVVLLLCGGDKRTQDADIARAVACWQDYQRRDNENTTPS
jgi:putative addiction module killer protein